MSKRTMGGPAIAAVVLFLLFIVGGVCALGALSSVDLSPVENTSAQNLTNTTADLAHLSLNVWTVLPVVCVAGAVFAAVWCLAFKGRRRHRR